MWTARRRCRRSQQYSGNGLCHSPEPASARQRYLHSSIGLSVLVPRHPIGFTFGFGGVTTNAAGSRTATVPAKNGTVSNEEKKGGYSA